MKFDILLPQVIHEQGSKPVQEDSVWPLPGKASIHDRLFVAVDGLGPENVGGTASQVVRDALTEYLFTNTCPDEPLTNDLLRMALVMAYEKLCEIGQNGVGVSLALLYMNRSGCTAVHIGDCRVYQIRPSSIALIYQSTDDFKVMMANSKNPVMPEVALLTDVRPGDYFLVCTKSLTSHLTDAQIVSIVCGDRDDARKRQLLLNRSVQVTENHSGVLVQVSGVMIEMTDRISSPAAGTDIATTDQVARQTSRQPAKPQQETEPERPQRQTAPSVEDEPDERKGGFPIVAVSAIAIVLAGCLLWWWMTRSTPSSGDDEPAPAVTQKTDSVPQKDTMKIVDTKAEVKKDTTRTNVNTVPTYRQQADSLLNAISRSEAETATSESGTASSNPVVTTTPEPPTAVDNGQSNADPAKESESSQPAATPQPVNPNGGVTPRPVIPDE